MPEEARVERVEETQTRGALVPEVPQLARTAPLIVEPVEGATLDLVALE
jgi:hypothetical protein